MSILFVGKRFYTNRDALRERYGRIWQLPWHWMRTGITTRLWLVDYHTTQTVRGVPDMPNARSTPVRNLAAFGQWMKELRGSGETVDVVVASGDCYIGLAGYLVARRLHARFVFDVYDKYDEFGGYHTPPGFDLFRFLMQHSDARLFASRALMHDLAVTTEHDHLVPNGVDLERFTVRDKFASRREAGLPAEPKWVGYFGGMEPDRGVADLIGAVQLLRATGMDIELLLGGRQVQGLDVHQDGIRYLGNVPYERMPTVLASCDLLAVPYRRSAFMDAGASNKVVEAIACRRPLVATSTPNLAANFPIQAKQLGSLIARPGDPSDLARVIRLQFDQQVLVEMPAGMSWGEIAMKAASDLGLAACASSIHNNGASM